MPNRPRSKRVFISDIHLGMNEKGWDWYQPAQHEGPLLELLRYVGRPESGVKDLVLNGDLFETWMCPIGTKPPRIADILAKHDAVLDEINVVAESGVHVLYAPGNHDMNVKPEDLAGRLPKLEFIKRYNAGLMYAEHGSRFAMFNAPDFMHDPSDGLPLGYFITRILAGHSDYTRPRAVFRYVDDLLEAAFTSKQLAESVIEALAEHAGHSLDAKVEMPGSRRAVSLREVQAKYATLFDRWVEKFGLRYTIRSIAAEAGEIGWFADREADKRDYRVVVLGHTHDHDFDEDGWCERNQRIYANSGYWCPKGGDAAHFVQVEKGPRTIDVGIYRMDCGTPVRVKGGSIAY